MTRGIKLEIAMVEDEIDQVDDVDFHRMVLSFDHFQEVLNQRPNYFMRNLVNFLVLFRRLLQNELHEFAGRGIDLEKVVVIVLLVMVVLEGVFLVDLRLDEVEGDVSDNVNIARVLPWWLNILLTILLRIFYKAFRRGRQPRFALDDKINHLFLSIQDDITKLAEVLDYMLSIFLDHLDFIARHPRK